MKANWPQIAEWIRESEGGFVDSPRDPGGATKFGITQRELEAWRKAPVSVEDVRQLGSLEANEILKLQYFDAVRGGELPSGLDYAVVDAAVNSGPVRAIKWLQGSLGIAADGQWGIVTQRAVEQMQGSAAGKIAEFDRERLGFLRHLRTWPVFRGGWFARVNLVTERSEALAEGGLA